MRKLWSHCFSSLCNIVLGVPDVDIFLLKTSVFLVLALMPFFWFGGRKTFVLQMMSLHKKNTTNQEHLLKIFSEMLRWNGVCLPEKSVSLEMVQWWLPDICIQFERYWRKTKIFFFSPEVILRERARRSIHVRRGVIVWSRYFRSPEIRANRSVSCYYLVAVQQNNLQKWGFPGSAGCCVVKVKRCSKCTCEEWSLNRVPAPRTWADFTWENFTV